MKVELLVVPDCPNAADARALLEAALVAADLAATPVETVVVAAQAQAEALGFAGSPSFYAEGRDLLPVPSQVSAVACRVYRRSDGTLAGIPEPDVLIAALRSAAEGTT